MARQARVILFEDDNGVRAFVQMFLEGKGYEVIVYENPGLCPLQSSHECRCSENERCADIILTDVDMPNVSGLDFIESQLGKGCKAQDIGIMSSAWSAEDRKRARDLGCTVLDKPVSMSTLTEWFTSCSERLDSNIALSNWFREAQNEY